MPLPMVHLGVAKNIQAAGWGLKELPQYFLGAISPDAIHMRPNSDRAAKNQTHLISIGKTWNDIDEMEYVAFLLEFIRQNQTKSSRDFLWGYGIHIYTDMLWTKQVYIDFLEKYTQDTSPIQDKRGAYYNDTDILDQVLYDESVWREDVWCQLQAAKGINFLDLLSANEINLWNERTLHWYESGESQHKNPVKYITKPDILSFINICSDRILETFNPHSFR